MDVGEQFIALCSGADPCSRVQYGMDVGEQFIAPCSGADPCSRAQYGMDVGEQFIAPCSGADPCSRAQEIAPLQRFSHFFASGQGVKLMKVPLSWLKEY